MDKCHADEITDINIKSLKGIEHFPNLIDLRYSGKNLEEVDLSKNAELVILIIEHGKLSSIDLSNNTKLTSLSLTHSLVAVRESEVILWHQYR